jgi:sterol desaturase/sphingolipid hydroxylase (fatty acid hydroxylase superfamily)
MWEVAMNPSYIVLAVPFFLALMAVELLVSRLQGKERYHLHDSLGSLSCGIGQQTLGLFTTAFGLWAYQALQQRFGQLQISPRSAVAWIGLFILDDFCYYLYHWASHRVHFFWATHAVHHQSEEYNLSTALRQSWFTSLTSWVFYIPLAILGFPFVMYLTVRTLNTLYQFWIHTRLIDRLGPLEWVFNTPSHHRVHHGIAPRHIDRNHAGMLIIWDRLFGTFQEEDCEPVYGVVKPLQRFDPWRANFEEWIELFELASRTARLRDKLLLFVMPPEWRPADLGGPVVVPEITREAQQRFEIRGSRAVDAYCAVAFVAVLAGFIWFLASQAQLSRGLQLLTVGELLLGLWTIGALIEQRGLAWPVELGRLLTLAIVGQLLLPSPLQPVAVGLCLGFTALLAVAYRQRGSGGDRELAVAGPAAQKA